MGSSSRFSTRSLKRRLGTAAYSRTSAPSILKSRSGTASSHQSSTSSCSSRLLVAEPTARSSRWQVRAVRVYRVPGLGIDARGFPGVSPGGRTPRPCLAGVFEAGIPLDTTGVVALIYPVHVRGCIRLRVRLPYPYVPHLLPPFLVALSAFGGRKLSLLSQRSLSAPVAPRRIALS